MTRTWKVASRTTAVLALGAALALGASGVAAASPRAHQYHHDNGGTCASAKVSPFDYAGGGLGGYVTAVTSDSVTVQLWNSTTATYAIGSSTTFTEGDTGAPASDLVVGDRVQIKVSSTSSTTAASINIELAELVGTVTGVSGDTILIRDAQGFTRTIVVGTATTYSEGSASATLSDVVSGAAIVAEGTVDANGTTLDALSVKVDVNDQNSHVSGVVEAFTSSSVTVLEGNGTTATFSYTTSTTFTEGKSTVTSSSVADGLDVRVSYTSAAPTSAVNVKLSPATLSGKVSAVSGDTITISGPKGTTGTIVVGTATTYSEGSASATLSAVVDGVRVKASGTLSAATTLDATSVVICVTHTPVATTTTTIAPQSRSTHGWGGSGHRGGHGHAGRGGRARH